jgi:transposase
VSKSDASDFNCEVHVRPSRRRGHYIDPAGLTNPVFGQAGTGGHPEISEPQPYLPVIRDTLAQYPRLRATRLIEMVKARGYTGSVVQLRRAVRLVRPAATATVYRRLTTLAAEEGQVDWGAFGSIRIGRGVRPLSGFVMVLAYSRAVFALFTVDQTLESLLRGHVEAFQTWSGIPRTLVSRCTLRFWHCAINFTS